MATLITLPHELQHNISNYLRPHACTGGNVAEVKIDPIAKAQDVASIKAVHSNLKAVPLWKNHEWVEHIRQWRDENLTKLRWKYQYGTLPDKMIKNGWVSKINNQYRSQNCFVETMVGTTLGTGFLEVPKEYKVIWFMKEFKEKMDLPSDYEFSYTDLFRMFLRELNVRPCDVREKEGYFKRSMSIRQLCLVPDVMFFE